MSPSSVSSSSLLHLTDSLLLLLQDVPGYGLAALALPPGGTRGVCMGDDTVESKSGLLMNTPSLSFSEEKPAESLSVSSYRYNKNW